MDKIFYTRHNGGITMVFNGKHNVVANDHPNFSQILNKLRLREFDKVGELMDISKSISAKGVSKKLPGRRVFVQKGKVFYDDSKNGKVVELHGTLVDRIMQDLGKPSFEKYGEALLMFLDNIKKNKIKDIREELYEWLMSGKTPITYDGCFLAYKNVRYDYKDLHSGKMDNSVGCIPRMPQDKVDPNRNNECSVGLHFASLGYMSSYVRGEKGHTMIVKVNPRHVFAIPKDYQFQKGRASEYFVVGEYKGSLDVDAFNDAFIDEDNKKTSCPNVDFGGGWLRPTIANMAKSYGLLVGNNQVYMTEVRGRKIPVYTNDKGCNWFDIIGTPVDIEEPVLMSIETKSVREALKVAFRKAERGFGLYAGRAGSLK